MNEQKTIAISGATGFVGSYLTSHFEQMGCRVLPIGRHTLGNEEELKSILGQAQIVINLAGAPINRIWTKTYKAELYDSRILTTGRIVYAINQLSIKPQLLISTSAIGYYPSYGHYDEYSTQRGAGFLPQLCYDWEAEARQVDPSVRLVIARLGVVMAHHGGAFQQMSLSTKFKLATVLGDAKHMLSWISIADVLGAILHIIKHHEIEGAVNLVSPTSISNRDLLNTLKQHYKSWVKLRVPNIIVRLFAGEAAEFIINSPTAIPTKLEESGYQFQHPSLVDFLNEEDV